MKFTIRDLLALVFLLALGLLAWRTWDDTRRQQAQLAELNAEIKELQALLRTDNRAIHAALLRTREDHRALATLRERSLEHFRTLQEKYRAIELRGPDVLSLRSVPSLATAGGPAPIVFRLIVPRQRSVWLKFARHAGSDSSRTSQSLDEDPSLRTQTQSGAVGPYELQLPAGDHTLQVAFKNTSEDSLPFRIELGKRLLLESALTAPRADGSSRSNIAATTQIDFPARRELPWLVTVRISPGQPDPGSTSALSMWLSDRSSDFARFPEP